MKTTLIIEDGLMRRLKALAAESGMTLSALVESFLRAGLHQQHDSHARERAVEALPSWNMGKPKVDLADREALERAMMGGPKLSGYAPAPAKQKSKRRARR